MGDCNDDLQWNLARLTNPTPPEVSFNRNTRTRNECGLNCEVSQMFSFSDYIIDL